MYPSIEIFGREAGTYGLMVLLGFVACFIVGMRLVKRFDIASYDFALLMLAVIGGLVIGAGIVYGISNIKTMIYAFSHMSELGLNAWDILTFGFGGMVYYGGFIGGGIAIVVYTKIGKKKWRSRRDGLLDVYAVMVPLFHGFGRIGCFLGGCCYGVESEFGFTTHTNTLNPSINGVNRFPIQLVESGLNFILFFVLLYMFCKHIMERRLIYIYMLTYPVIRFIDEFFRGDTYRGFFFGLSTSQWISIFLFVFALIMLPIKNKKIKAETAENALSGGDAQ